MTAAVRLSPRLRVRFTATDTGLDVHWIPGIPADGLTAAEAIRYRAERNVALIPLATKLGGAIVVMEAL